MKIKPKIKPLLILALVLLLSSNQNIAQNVGIGSSSFTPDPSAVLELQSSQQGFLPPRMTTEQRDEIQNPATGLQVYNLTTDCLEIFANGIWQEIFCAECPYPASPTEGSHLTSETEIVWNWNAVSGVIGYKINNINNFATATNNGLNTSYTQSNLGCGEHKIYVWAYIGCGYSEVLELTARTSITFMYFNEEVTYGTALGGNNRCWLDRNLGATQLATSSTDINAYGHLFQWGRAYDGHQIRTSSTTTTLSSTDNPTNSRFIRPNQTPWDWRSPQNGNLWQGVNGINNPCPSGWRVPTEAEWQTELLSWQSNDAEGAFNSQLKLTMAGDRSAGTGALSSEGTAGSYWTTTNVTGSTKHVTFSLSGTNIHSSGSGRAFGRSVRCIKN